MDSSPSDRCASTAPKEGVFERLEGVLEACINDLCSKPNILCKNPAKDFTRNRKITPQTLLRFYIAIDGKCIKKATCDFMHQQGKENATYQAFSLQRAKLTQEAFPYLFKTFNEATRQYDTRTYSKGYSLLAVDGTGLTIATNENGASYMKACDSNQFWTTVLYDTENETYLDLDVRTRQKQYEVDSCIQMVKRNQFKPKTILTGDRLYACLNLYEHLNRKGLFYVIRCKTAKTLWEINELPDAELDVVRTIRVHTTQTKDDLWKFKHHISHQMYGRSKFGKHKKQVTWDFEDHWAMTVRFVKFKLSSGEWEVLATNLPSNAFSLSELKELYHRRWAIETSFMHLKYNISLINLHSRKDEFVVQDIYASFIAFNFCSRVKQALADTLPPDKMQAINVSQAFYLVKQGLRNKANPFKDLDALITSYKIPIRPGRTDRRKTIKSKRVTPNEYRVA